MRILVLSKRQYTGKDLLDDAYGRCYELPIELAALGHEVQGVCASYRQRAEGVFNCRREGAEVRWHALNVQPLAPWSLYRWARALEERVRAFKPDVVWACSDSFHAILGVRLQRRSGVPCVVDLYDNFESYLGAAIPGVRPVFRSHLGHASAITCVTAALERYVRGTCEVRGEIQVLENGISPEFRPMERAACRQRFGLPSAASVIGTAGSISSDRGIEALFEAFLRLSEKRRDLRLLLAGRVGGGTRIPAHERIVYLGQLPLADVPHVIGAMDVAVVCNKRSAFGDYCFPQKLYEVIACGVPPLVANTAGVAALLERSPANRYEPASVDSLVAGLERLLSGPALPAIAPVSWKQHGARLAAFLARVAGGTALRRAAG